MYEMFLCLLSFFGAVLDRSCPVCIAMLCGSDYTDGVRGVGPVTALEILAHFRGVGLQTLQRFASVFFSLLTLSPSSFNSTEWCCIGNGGRAINRRSCLISTTEVTTLS